MLLNIIEHIGKGFALIERRLLVSHKIAREPSIFHHYFFQPQGIGEPFDAHRIQQVFHLLRKGTETVP